MNLRNYNIYFHTHTISGILICAVLYVIFFAGSLSFFKKEIQAWQHNQSAVVQQDIPLAYDTLLDSLDQQYNLFGRDLAIYQHRGSLNAYITLFPTKDTILNINETKRTNFSYNLANSTRSDYRGSYDLGEFLYRLHFLAQLNHVPIRLGVPFGYMLAGIISFLFLFALITGLMLHWNKIVSNFFTFRPFAKWKTIWTDEHTALGVIGFPYQFMFAVTGIVLIFNTALITPFEKLLYNKDEAANIYDDIYGRGQTKQEYLFVPTDKKPNLEHFLKRTNDLWPSAIINSLQVTNYGDASMAVTITGEASTKTNFSGTGRIVYHVETGHILEHKSPITYVTYTDRVKSLVYRLHLGDFGGYPLKIVYFILGIMGCIVIVSGILIWLVARDKKNIPNHKRKFNFWAANVFVAICLTMYPVTALSFIAVKIAPHADMQLIYRVYFYSWLILSLYYIARRNLHRTNRETLLTGSFLGFVVPITNGIYDNNWPWNTFLNNQLDILFIDILWIILSIISFICYRKIKLHLSN